MAKTAKTTGAKARRQVNRLPPEQRIADIMRAAREVFTERGYSDALISENRRAGWRRRGQHLSLLHQQARSARARGGGLVRGHASARRRAIRGDARRLEPDPLHRPSSPRLDPQRAGALPPCLPGAAGLIPTIARPGCSSSTRPIRTGSSMWCAPAWLPGNFAPTPSRRWRAPCSTARSNM